MKIKKLIAAVMAFAMLTVFVQPCFAVSIAEITDFISNPFNLPQMSMQVTARESGVGDYTSSLAVTSATASSVDYKATLDMSTVRDLFDEGFLTDNTGQRVDFKNVLIIATSNVGTKTANE